MNHAAVATDRVICHCLQVKESQIVDAIAVTGAESLRDVVEHTGAGAGCTACHCRIRELLGCRTAASAGIVEVARA
jgi:NAD(P)H-nitrite reductase large subunit